MKLLVTRRYTPSVETALKQKFDVTTLGSAKPLSGAEMRSALESYDAILVTIGDVLSAESFTLNPRTKTPRTKIIANFGAGTDHIDLDAARAVGICVTNTPDVVTEPTADLAMMLILMSARRASEGEALLRAGKWGGWGPTDMLGHNVSGGKLGIIGFGRIGRALAHRAHFGFGMEIACHNRSPIGDTKMPVTEHDLPTLLETSQFIAVAVPGGPATRHMLNARTIGKMRSNSFLINTARGDVVDTNALIDALNEGQIAGAGLDVHEGEPDVDRRLTRLPNVTLLPHMGTATTGARDAMGRRAMENLEAFDQGKEPRDLVN